MHLVSGQAGLFSAILTAFNVQSYPLLQPSPPDPSLAALREISHQLRSFTIHQPFVNATYSVDSLPEVTAPRAPRTAVVLNILWFSSLICSLSAASIGIMVKQWLHEYRAGVSGDSHEAARLRQYRLNNLMRWHVSEIVALLPVLLQLSLVLFFAGLLVLLWSLHSVVAAVASVLVGTIIASMCTAIVLPIWRTDCCYLSPPTYALFRLTRHIRRLWQVGLERVLLPVRRLCRRLSYSTRLPSYLRPRLSNFSLPRSRYNSVSAQETLTWRGQEQLVTSRLSSQLDRDLIVTAYQATMDASYLSETAAVTITALDPHVVVQCFDEVHATNVTYYGHEPFYKMPGAPADFWLGALLALIAVPETRRTGPQAFTALRYVNWSRLQDNGSLRPSTPARSERLLLTSAMTWYYSSQSTAYVAAAPLATSLWARALRELPEECPWRTIKHGASVGGCWTTVWDSSKCLYWVVAAAIEHHMSALMDAPDGEKDMDSNRDTRCKVIWCISLLSHCCIKRVPFWEAARTDADREAVTACAQRILSALLDALESSIDDDFDVTMFADLIAPFIAMLSDSPIRDELVTDELVELLGECLERIPATHMQSSSEGSTWFCTVLGDAQAAVDRLKCTVRCSRDEGDSNDGGC